MKKFKIIGIKLPMKKSQLDVGFWVINNDNSLHQLTSDTLSKLKDNIDYNVLKLIAIDQETSKSFGIELLTYNSIITALIQATNQNPYKLLFEDNNLVFNGNFKQIPKRIALNEEVELRSLDIIDKYLLYSKDDRNVIVTDIYPKNKFQCVLSKNNKVKFIVHRKDIRRLENDYKLFVIFN